jgi:hypothetical protein
MRTPLPAPPPQRGWLAPVVVPVLKKPEEAPDEQAIQVPEFEDDLPIHQEIPLKLNRSDPLFDSNIWLWRTE